jgi:hypothetical protein
VPGLPMQVTKNGSDITLSWAPSCSVYDTDYEVYEGDLGAFRSHVPRLCTTSGSTSAALTPGSGSKYYLIVPRNSVWEGSYGRSSSGLERSQSPAACTVQAIGPCSYTERHK